MLAATTIAAPAMLRVDRVGDFLAGVRLARRDHHLGALIGQRLGDRPADPARRAGDDRDLAGEIEQIILPVIQRAVTPCSGLDPPSPDDVSRRMLGELDPRDRPVVHLVRPVGQAQRPDPRPARRQPEILADAGAAMRLHRVVDDPQRHVAAHRP